MKGVGRRCPSAHLREAALIIALCLLYAAVSSLPRDGIDQLARHNAERLIAFENSLGLFQEAAWNQWLVGMGDGIAAAFNWAYILTFMAVIPASALAYYVAARDRYFQLQERGCHKPAIRPRRSRSLPGCPAANDGGVRLR